jgi:hypothetical protein
VTRLEDCDLSERLGRQTAFLALRELDAALLSTDGLVNLLVLKRRSETDDEDGTRRTLGDLFQRLTNWLVIHEGEPLGPTADPHQFTLRIRRLQSFLHLVDADGTQVEARENMLRARRVLTTRVLLTRLRSDQGCGAPTRAVCRLGPRHGRARARGGGRDLRRGHLRGRLQRERRGHPLHLRGVHDARGRARARRLPGVS